MLKCNLNTPCESPSLHPSVGSRTMLAWDIETMGLNPNKSLITVATTYCPEKSTIYLFAMLDAQKNVVKIHDFDAKKDAFLKELDEAPILAGYNAISFDVPFIATVFDVAPERVMKWLMKSVDIFESCKQCCGRTFGLNHVLDLNNFSTKTGDGLAAVRQAERGEWLELGAYCLDDSSLTYEISNRKRIALPEGYKWRNANGGRTHDASNILFMNIDENYQISFEKGILLDALVNEAV
jgi:hypothetical protein